MLATARIVVHMAAGAATLAVITSVSACGGGGADEEPRIRRAYVDLQGRFEARDPNGVCARISEAAKEQVGSLGHAQPTTCVRDIRQMFKWVTQGAARDVARPKLMRVAVDGDAATITARLVGETTGRIPFVEEDGDWKLDSLFGISGPPPADMR